MKINRLIVRDGKILGGGYVPTHRSKNNKISLEGDVLFFEENKREDITELLSSTDSDTLPESLNKPYFILYKFTRDGEEMNSSDLHINDILYNLPLKDRNLNDAYKYLRTLSEQESVYNN